jgi:hypothetical protein
LRSKQELSPGLTPAHVEVAPPPPGFAVECGRLDDQGKLRRWRYHLHPPIDDLNLISDRIPVIRSKPGLYDA